MPAAPIPRAAAREVAKVARDAGLSGTRIGIVEGDDLLPTLDRLRADGVTLENMDTGEEGLDRISNRIVAANAYLGADGIIEQLQGDADVIVAGRVSDNALHVAPIMHEFGWSYDDEHVDRIAAAITVGHLIECTACATGGMSNMWRISDRTWQVGFPIAEIAEDGTATITKLEGSGGIVNEWTIKEHLLYEIIDPNNYVMPDGVADFTSVQLDDLGRRPRHRLGCARRRTAGPRQGLHRLPRRLHRRGHHLVWLARCATQGASGGALD